MDMIKTLAAELQQNEQYVANVVKLLDEGNTVPFIARYRKEMHGTMDDQTIRVLAERLAYLRGLETRKAEIRDAIDAQGKLTPELTAAIENAATLSALDDIYRPYRPKRLKQYSQDGKLDENVMDAIMTEEKPIEEKLVLKGDVLAKYVPRTYTPSQKQKIIVKLLEDWHKRQLRQQER